MVTKRTTRQCSNTDAPCLPIAKSSNDIVSDYARGSRIASFMLAGMFAFMALGAVMLGW